jgi:hypothetical protein
MSEQSILRYNLRATRKRKDVRNTLLHRDHDHTVGVTHRERGHNRRINNEQVVHTRDLEVGVDDRADGGGTDPVVRAQAARRVVLHVVGHARRRQVRREELDGRVGLRLVDDVVERVDDDGLVGRVLEPRRRDGLHAAGRRQADATTRSDALREVDGDGEELAGVVRLARRDRDTGTWLDGTLRVADTVVGSRVRTPEVKARRRRGEDTRAVLDVLADVGGGRGSPDSVPVVVPDGKGK